eukprot:SAG11_NODE_1721_length_4374_cov_5.296374_2_plen_380_part_00
MATPPRDIAGEQLHREALESLRHYPASHMASWGAPKPNGDMPYGRKPPAAQHTFSRSDIDHFCREGYVVLPDFYSAEEVAALNTATSKALARLGAERQGANSSADMFYGDVAFAPVDGPADPANPHRVGYVNDLHLHQPVLIPTEAHPKLLSCLTELLGPDIDAWQVATVVKSPHLVWSGGGYSWHQDIADYGGSGDCDGSSTTYTYHGMTNFANVCAITYLNDVAPDQGATSLIPRSHRSADGSEGPIRRPLFTTAATDGLWNGPYRTVEGIDEIESSAVTPSVSRGTVLLFDSWMVHRANINCSSESKIGLINVYCRPDTLPAAGPRADGTGTLGLALVRNGQLVSVAESLPGVGDDEVALQRRGWGDLDRRGRAKL